LTKVLASKSSWTFESSIDFSNKQGILINIMKAKRIEIELDDGEVMVLQEPDAKIALEYILQSQFFNLDWKYKNKFKKNDERELNPDE